MIESSKHYINCEYDYSGGRDVINVEIMLWAYGVTGEQKLLRLAQKSYSNYNKKSQAYRSLVAINDKELLTRQKMYVYGVTYNAFSKLVALLYYYSGDKEKLKLWEKAMQRLERYYKLPCGCISNAEYMCGNKYFDSTEICDISDYTWTPENLMAIISKKIFRRNR